MSALTISVLHGATGKTPDEQETLATAETIREILTSAGHATQLVRLRRDMAALHALGEERPDLVFNLVDAIEGDGAAAAQVPGELERLGLSFTGCRSHASLACLSKPAMKRAMRMNELPTPDWSLTGRELAHLGQVIVKASHEHASIGMDARSVVPGIRVAREIEARTKRYKTPFFAEAYVDGREFNLSLLDGPNGAEVLPPAEIAFVDYPEGRPKIVDYDSKWVPGAFGFDNTPRVFEFANTDTLLLKYLRNLALRCWRVFALTGYARVDFRVDRTARPWILEVNTNPCLAPDAGFAAAAERAGLSYPDLVNRIVDAALPGRKAA